MASYHSGVSSDVTAAAVACQLAPPAGARPPPHPDTSRPGPALLSHNLWTFLSLPICLLSVSPQRAGAHRTVTAAPPGSAGHSWWASKGAQAGPSGAGLLHREPHTTHQTEATPLQLARAVRGVVLAPMTKPH